MIGLLLIALYSGLSYGGLCLVVQMEREHRARHRRRRW